MRRRNSLRSLGSVASLFLLSACAPGVAGAVEGGLIGNVLDLGNHRMIDGNYNLVSIGGHALPAPIPASWVGSPPCPLSSITASRVTTGRMILSRTSTAEGDYRGNVSVSTTTEVTCRGDRAPRVVTGQLDGRYRVAPDVSYNLVQVYFPATDATQLLKRDGRNLVLDPQEYVFRKGPAPADSARS